MIPAPTSTTSVFGVSPPRLSPLPKVIDLDHAASYQAVSHPAIKVSCVTAAWEPDVLTGYWQTTLALGPDPDGEGDVVATLIRRGEPSPGKHAVLAVHGYTDYFFHTELADRLTARGFAFYAIDLHKCGRSWREGQTPHFTTDLSRYDAELERAAAVIRRETAEARILVYGHSAGGLIVTLWLDRLRRRGARSGVSGLVLNSPFFDLHGPAILRAGVTSAAIRRGDQVRQQAGAAGDRRRRVRDEPAPRLRRRVRLQPDVEAAGRVSGHGRLDQRGPARADAAAPRAGRRRAEPDPALGPKRARDHRPGDDAARRRGAGRRADRAVGRLRRQPHHRRPRCRRQARRVPVAAACARGRLPRAGGLAGLVHGVRGVARSADARQMS